MPLGFLALEMFLSLPQPRLPVIEEAKEKGGRGNVENMKQRLLRDHVDKAGSHWSSFSGSVQCCGRRTHCSHENNDLLFSEFLQQLPIFLLGSLMLEVKSRDV